MAKVEQPTARETRDGTEYSHPAFGMIGVSRVQGNAVLVGSDFVHHNFIVVHINNATLHRSLSRDWWFQRNELISVALSEAQWATMISSLNVGGGVPCKIEHIKGEQMPDVPHRQQTSHFARETNEHLRSAIDRIDKLIAAGGLTRAKMDELRGIKMEIADNMPFVQDQFDRHVESTIEKAKIEINSHITSVVARSGIKALANETHPIELLPSPADDKRP